MTLFYPSVQDPTEMVTEVRDLADALARIAAGDGPSVADLADAPFLLDYEFRTRDVPVLAGKVSGHPVLDGRRIQTSELFVIDADAGWARTWSRYYALTPSRPRKKR